MAVNGGNFFIDEEETQGSINFLLLNNVENIVN